VVVIESPAYELIVLFAESDMAHDMMELAIETLRSSINIAVVGLSRYPGKPAHDIPVLISRKGYNVVGINPSAPSSIAGIEVVGSLIEVELDIDILCLFRPSSDTDAIIDEALERRERDGDVHCIWLQEGITSKEGARKCAEAGITYIEDSCIYVIQQYLRV